MVVLEICRNRDVVETVSLDLSKVGIGRSPRNDVVVEDGVCSPFHAGLERSGPTYLLCDRGSRSGTMLNGKPIRRAVVTDGDKITIGETILRFRQEDLSHSPAPRKEHDSEESTKDQTDTKESSALPSQKEVSDSKDTPPSISDSTRIASTSDSGQNGNSLPQADPGDSLAYRNKRIRMRLSGSVVAASAERLQKLFDDAIEHGPSQLTIDFTKVRTITHGGWKAILKCLSGTRRANVNVCFTGMSKDIEHAFDVLRMDLLVEKK